MEFVLFVAACLAFSLSPAHAPLALRCGLAACLRFSPRAAIALSAVAAFSGHLGALAGRGGLRAVPPAQRPPVACAAVVGGTLGRMALLLFVARFSGSLALAQLQAAALLVLCAAALLPGRVGRMRLPRSRAGLFALSACCAAAEGFFGCGASALFLLAAREGVRRRAVPAAALLLGLLAQASALLLTLLSGGAQVFPLRIPMALALGALLGGWRFERQKERGGVLRGLRVALFVYVLLAALAGAEQAYVGDPHGRTILRSSLRAR